MTQPIREFTKSCQSETIRIDGETFTVVELDGTGRDAYFDEMSTRMEVVQKQGEDKPTVKLKSMAGVQTNLVHLSLRDDRGQPVPKAVIAKWPASTLEGICEIARRLSHLEKEGEEKGKEAAKND